MPRPVEPDLPVALLASWGRYRLTWMMGCHETKGQTCTEYAHDLTGHKFSLKPGIQILMFMYFLFMRFQIAWLPEK